VTTIRVDFGALASAHSGLVATWGRIESNLRDLEAAVATTADMDSSALAAYRSLEGRWYASAAERQAVLRSLATVVDDAASAYRRADAAAAAQFAI
jgi:uncharacterized protein YukE